MKNFMNTVLSAGFVLLLALPLPAAAATETPAANTYAFVNINQVMHDSEAGATIRKELDGKGQQFQAELSKENKDLSALRQEFEKGKASLAPADAEKKMRELESKYAAADKMLQERRHMLNRAGSASFAALKKEAVGIIIELSKEKGYSAVFSQESVILAADEYDITEEVIKRLNAKVKRIPIDWSAKPKAAPKKQ